MSYYRTVMDRVWVAIYVAIAISPFWLMATKIDWDEIIKSGSGIIGTVVFFILKEIYQKVWLKRKSES